MKVLLIILFASLSNLLFSQSIVLNPQYGNKAPVILKEGDMIYVMIKDTLYLESSQKLIKERKYNGFIEVIENETLILKYRKNNFISINANQFISINTNQIVKIKKQFPILQPLGFLPVAGVVLVYLHAVDQLYLGGPASVYLLGASILYRLSFNLLLNPQKRISPELWKKRNRWALEVVIDKNKFYSL
jgi:hypothetical protein